MVAGVGGSKTGLVDLQIERRRKILYSAPVRVQRLPELVYRAFNILARFKEREVRGA
jgi:hypothetical protein